MSIPRLYFVATMIGFIGGPISAALSPLSLYLCKKFNRSGKFIGNTWVAGGEFELLKESLITWVVIGLVAMPISWGVSNSLGWNFDPVAFVQSGLHYKSYKDWDAAEDAARVKKNLQFSIEQKRQRAAENIEQERKRAQEQTIWEEDQRRIMEQKTKEEARIQAIKDATNERIRKELDASNDPILRENRNKAHIQHLLSVGCLDSSGEVIRSLFCLNTEAPPR